MNYERDLITALLKAHKSFNLETHRGGGRNDVVKNDLYESTNGRVVIDTALQNSQTINYFVSSQCDRSR